MNIMFVLLPLAMLVILLALGALFWVSKVRADNAIAQRKNQEVTTSEEQHPADKP